MDLFRTILHEEVEKLQNEKVQVRFLGDLARFPDDIQRLMKKTHDANNPSDQHMLGIAASYGGRAEILAAVNAAIKGGEKELTEESFSQLLWTQGIPDPDIIIRTGGEHRLSGFLTWESIYSELFFTDTYWPDFSKEEFHTILDAYSARERRHGK
jgi:undecaprenyl diphosphate synthase